MSDLWCNGSTTFPENKFRSFTVSFDNHSHSTAVPVALTINTLPCNPPIET
jgi:hypothetical protein